MTYWPEGRRRGRAGGRQEYRHLSGLAQPSQLQTGPALQIYWFPQVSVGFNCAKGHSWYRVARWSGTGRRPYRPSHRPSSFRATIHPTRLTLYVDSYQRSGDVGLLFDQLKALAKRTSRRRRSSRRPSPFGTCPKSSSRSTSAIVADSPNDAQAMVVLANSYWLDRPRPRRRVEARHARQGDRSRTTAAPGTSGRSPRRRSASASSGGSR